MTRIWFTRILLWLIMIGAILGAMLLANPNAKADSDGCEEILWGFLATQRRVLCDGPLRPDGSWTRERVILTPAHQVPTYCYGSYRFMTCSGGYFVGRVVNSAESYPVNPEIVLPDEPGYLG